MKHIVSRGALAALAVLAACSEQGGVTLPPASPEPAAPLAAISCTATVGEGRVQCADASGPA
ncbi:MAG: hypothetical protein ACJ8J0_08730, partial [Longimicrobiaceae bacterium]